LPREAHSIPATERPQKLTPELLRRSWRRAIPRCGTEWDSSAIASGAKRLAGEGYLAFAFDFRNYGRSQRVGYARARRLAGDVAAAARFLRAHGAKKVFLIGASMRGTAVLASAANIRPPVDGVISVSGPASFGGADAVGGGSTANGAGALLVAANDSGFMEDARALYAATSSSDKSIEILPGSDHGVLLLSYAARARQLVEQFLASH
jgi:dienelactone hydrolase